MTKLLNLDALPTNKDSIGLSIKLKGETYEMRPLSVRRFIETVKVLDGLDKKPVEEGAGIMLGMIADTFPTMPKEVLDDLSFDQMTAILEFVNSVGQTGSEDAGEAGEDEGNAPAA